MPYTDEQINELIAESRANRIKIAIMEDAIRDLSAEFDLYPKPQMRRKAIKDFPPLERLTKIQAQLFHNAPNTTGKHGGARQHEWVVKLELWDCAPDKHNRYLKGTIMPFEFVMKQPDMITPKRDDSRLAQEIANGIHGIDLIGWREIKGYGQAKGTETNENQVTAILSDRSLAISTTNWPNLLQITRHKAIANPTSNQATDVWTWEAER